jgi:predicted SAM-dependent methyltransferase
VPESPTTIRAYLDQLRSRGSAGLDRGRAAEALRKVSSPAMREQVKLKSTVAVAPLSRRKAPRLLEDRSEVRLHLGSGTNYLDGWINVDILGMSPDLLWDLRMGVPFPDACADIVCLEHVLEHFVYSDVLDVMSECRRVLKPGGLLRVGVPDFGSYIESYSGDHAYIETNRPDRPTPLLAVAEVVLSHGHRSAWDGETLVRFLEETGFESVRRCEWGESAIEPVPDSDKRRTESVYAEGRRPSE